MGWFTRSIQKMSILDYYIVVPLTTKDYLFCDNVFDDFEGLGELLVCMYKGDAT